MREGEGYKIKIGRRLGRLACGQMVVGEEILRIERWGWVLVLGWGEALFLERSGVRKVGVRERI